MNHRKEDNYVLIEKFFNKTSIYKNKNELSKHHRKIGNVLQHLEYIITSIR